MNGGNLQVVPVLSIPFAQNSYLLYRDGEPQAIIIDPGMEPERILHQIRKRKLQVSAILNTHGHGDHIAGNAAMKEAFPDAPLMIGVGDEPMLRDPVLNLSRPFGIDLISPHADRLLVEGDTVQQAGFQLRVRDLPGHSPGHIVFLLEEAQPVVVFGGDTLFQGSIGRTDFPGGSHQQLLDGIRTVLFTLPDDTIIFPGHGEPTTVGVEKRENPFLT